MQLIGQDANLDIISKWDTLPNFVIIQGSEHTGKNYFVLYLCKLYGLHYVKISKSVKDIRNLVEKMSRNSNTLFHLDNFDDASLQAKNALLKVTEETLPGNHIVITGGPQIKTLQSRARIIVMSPYKYDDIKDLYSKYYNDFDSVKLYNAGVDTPAKIEFYKDCKQLKDLLDYTYTIFDRITYIDVMDYIPMLKLFDGRYEKGTVDLCSLFLEMLIKLIENKMIESNQYSYYEILNIITKIKNQLRREDTLNRRFLLLKMFYRNTGFRTRKIGAGKQMKQLKDLKQDILNGNYKNFYVFYGEDFGLRKHYIDAIKVNYDRVVVLDDYMGLSDNKGFSLIVTKTLYIIYNCDSFCKLSVEQINGFIKKIQSDCVIFDYENSHENSTLFKEFDGYITYFPLVNSNIGSEFVRSEIDLIMNNNKTLAYNCFNNYSTIRLEADKIKNYAQFKGMSDEQAYEVLYANNQLVTRFDEYNNDILVNDLLTNNSNEFSYWGSLIKEKYSQEFWYNLSRTVNDFLIAYLVQRYGKYPGSSKAYELGLPWNRAKVIRELNIFYNADILLYYVAEIANMDYMMKIGKLKQEDLFDYLVYTVM